MAMQNVSDDPGPAGQGIAPRGGSIGMVMLVAVLLVGASIGLLLIGRGYVDTYILVLLAALAMVGVFALFAGAAGLIRLGAGEDVNVLGQAVCDGAAEGVLVTDSGGRVLYANPAYRAITNAAGSDDVRPVERVFVGDPDMSEAVYRLAKAAREGKSLQEEVRVSALREGAARWLRLRVRPLAGEGAHARSTVWTVADITRDRERQENVFQELQHAIDYLDH
ncbi:MAG: PAS domain-containing protein, partial [Rhizobiales bacterium]|nr:PAS domain-containing protein [Hyphomicrobiales bacterium]